MMVLPSLLDVFIVIVLVLPGFVAFSIAKFLAVFERKLEEFETVVWSLLLSLLIYGLFSLATEVTDFDTLRERILGACPQKGALRLSGMTWAGSKSSRSVMATSTSTNTHPPDSG